ncbi:MAG: SH3 domain-containing protein [Chloroflexaceae bacterium]
MIELNRNPSPSPLRSDVERLQQRISHHRHRYRHQRRSFAQLRTHFVTTLSTPGAWFSRLPARLFIHLVVILIVPLALVLSQLPMLPVALPEPEPSELVEAPIGVGPIALEAGTQSLVGDPPLPDDEALPPPVSISSRSAVMAPLTVQAMIGGDVVRLRNGPGLAYDEVGRVNGGDGVEVIGRFEEWLQVRRDGDPTVYWVAAELVDIPDTVVYALNQVPAETIPPPPPPKVGVVREDNVNLRDGPGTNYVSMARMRLGQELTLIERYEGWFLVEYGQLYGWVTSDFLNIVDGVVERVPVATSIPDPNPPLVGSVLENNVNVRKGPGSAYDRITSLKAGTSVSLLARHKDWYRVQLPDGTRAWIFSDLLRVSPMAARRVPVTNDIPALPARVRPAATGGGAGGSRGAAAVNIPASGDVASFAVQFVGSRYVWGGSSPSRGFDCSGLTSYVYRQFGVSLPHNAAAQYSSRYGAIIGGMGNLAPGDLMFFAGTAGRRGISHVAIYIGGGQMVHAMTPRYGVQVSSIWSSYWQNTFVGAVRPYR